MLRHNSIMIMAPMMMTIIHDGGGLAAAHHADGVRMNATDRLAAWQ